MTVLFGLFTIVAISNGICTILTAQALGMSYWDYIQLSDFGMMVKMFEVYPLWAFVNIAAASVIMVFIFLAMVGGRRAPRPPLYRAGFRGNWAKH